VDVGGSREEIDHSEAIAYSANPLILTLDTDARAVGVTDGWTAMQLLEYGRMFVMSRAKGTKAAKGRLVWNHSTHLPGLVPVLERLANCPGICTVTPAVLRTVRSNAQTFRVKISVPIQGGFKLIARKGRTA